MRSELQSDDIVVRYLQQEYIRSYLETFSDQVRVSLHVSSMHAEQAYLYERIAKQALGQTVFYCIFDAPKDQLIGAIEIRDADAHRGQLYCWMHHSYWGSGKFQTALALVCQEYFVTTGALFLNAFVDQANKRSYLALKKFGFADVAVHNGPAGMQYELVLRKQ